MPNDVAVGRDLEAAAAGGRRARLAPVRDGNGRPIVVRHRATPAQHLTALLLAAIAVSGRAHAQDAVTVSASKGDIAHVEPHLATNPRDPREVVIAAMRVSSPSDIKTWEVRPFSSADAGRTWREGELPAKDGVRCAGDPWLTWGRARSVYLACLAPVPTPDARDFHFEIFLYRSRDAGRSWAPPLQVPVDTVGEWDHPVVVRAPAASDTAADVLWIVGARPRRSGNEFGLVRYHDDSGGRFGPMRRYRPPEPGNHNFGAAAALDSGHVAFTYFTMNPSPPRPLYAVRASPDGFQRSAIRESVTPWGFPMLSGRQEGDTGLAVIHAVWLEGTRAAGLDVMLARSRDGGRTWTPPETVTNDRPLAFRARPAAAGDGHGKIAVTWFESSARTGCGDVHLRMLEMGRTGGTVRDQQFRGAAPPCPSGSPLGAVVDRWPGGGDYAGIQAPVPGVIDLVWADARADGHQVRFARMAGMR